MRYDSPGPDVEAPAPGGQIDTQDGTQAPAQSQQYAARPGLVAPGAGRTCKKMGCGDHTGFGLATAAYLALTGCAIGFAVRSHQRGDTFHNTALWPAVAWPLASIIYFSYVSTYHKFNH